MMETTDDGDRDQLAASRADVGLLKRDRRLSIQTLVRPRGVIVLFQVLPQEPFEMPVLSKNSSARQSALTAPRISAARHRSKGPQKAQIVCFGGTAGTSARVPREVGACTVSRTAAGRGPPG